MPVALEETAASVCLGCGELVDGDAAFCPTCGTRQVADRPMPVDDPSVEAARLERSTHAWLLAGLAAVAVLLLLLGVVVGGLVTGALDDSGDAGGDEAGDSTAAAAMETHRPLAEEWMGKHDHLVGEVEEDDPNGLAAAATDARLWIDVNREAMVASIPVEGESGPLYEELVAVFDERAAVLAGIEATASEGGGAYAVADEMASLDQLDAESDAATCAIADVMRSEGDDPDDHISQEMFVTC